MNAVVRVLLALPLAAALAALAALAAGCAGTPSVGDCPALDLEPPVTLTKQDRSYRHSVFCEWSVGETTKVRAHYYQPTRYDAQTRADTATENAWRRDEGIRQRFGRNFLPPLENPPLGEQAVLDFGYNNETASATVMARKGVRVVEVRYTAPEKVAVGKGTDPKYYATAKAVVVEVAGELLG